MNCVLDHALSHVFPLSIILGGDSSYYWKTSVSAARWRRGAEYEVLSNFILEESEAIGISIVHLHNSRSTTDTGERPRSRVESRSSYRVLSCNPFFFSRVYQNMLDYRTSLLLTMREREYTREKRRKRREELPGLVLQIRGWLKSSCGIKTAGDNRDERKRREKKSDDYSLIVLAWA